MLKRFRLRLRRPSGYELLAISLAVAALGGFAYAAIPAADGTFRGCYAKTNGIILGIPHNKGDLRLVNEGEACRSYETLVTWNRQGQPGAPGAPGVSGYEIVTVVAPAGSQVGVADCPAGKKVVGGGHNFVHESFVDHDGPADEGQQWRIRL